MRANTRVTGRQIVQEIVRNMEICTEVLEYRAIAPRAYDVYLHPDDWALLEGILPEIEEDARRALAEKVVRLNRDWPIMETIRAKVGAKSRKHELPPDPELRIFRDAEGRVEPGEVQVDGRFPPRAAEHASGNPTEQVFTTHTGRTSAAGGTWSAGAARRLLATLSYTDDHGAQVYRMEKPSLVVGRGGPGYWVDLKLRASLDVSREHLRLRHDPGAGGRFFLKDLSRLGTTLDGIAVPSSIEQLPHGEKRDLGLEVPMPPTGVIGLAGVLFIEFRAEPAR
jgi:hypothetical protein